MYHSIGRNVGPEEEGIGGTDLLQTARPKAGLIYISVAPQAGWLCVSESPTGLLNEYRFPGLIPDLLNEFLLVVPGFLYFLNVSLTAWWVVCILEHGEATFL